MHFWGSWCQGAWCTEEILQVSRLQPTNDFADQVAQQAVPVCNKLACMSYITQEVIAQPVTPLLLEFWDREPSCVYPGASAMCTKCGCSTCASSWPAVTLSSCTGCLLGTALSSRSWRWCTTFYINIVCCRHGCIIHGRLNDITSDRHKPKLPWTRMQFGKCTFFLTYVRNIWNSLPTLVCNIDSHPAFALKSHLFHCVFIG